MPESTEPTPYAVRCYQCKPDGDHLVYLDYEEYIRQMMRPDSFWMCPSCGEEARWSDDNYERRMPEHINDETGEPSDGEWEE